MTDRELLEAAAKAAGIGGGWDWPRGAKAPVCYRGATGQTWNPLADDGDALRLAVKLEIHITNSKTYAWASTLQRTATEYIERGPYAATRRAIVRAAAEIGRAVP